MKEVHKKALRLSIWAISYLPVIFRFTHYHYDPFWYTFVKISADVAAISFFWLILSGFPQGVLRGFFPQQFSIRFHNWLAPFAFIILLIHPIGNAIAYMDWNILLPFAHKYGPLLSLGPIALILLILVVLSSYTIRERYYEYWHVIHYLSYGFFFTFYAHALFSLDLSTPIGLYHLLLFTLGTIAILMKALFDLKMLSLRVRVVEKSTVSRKTYNLILDVPDPLAKRWKPGQFVLIARSRFGDHHPLSISKLNPGEGTIEITFKIFGDWSENLAKIRKGSWVYVNGPYGEMGDGLEKGRGGLVFIAGGIGVTPFRAMIHHLLANGSKRKIWLFHGCREDKDFAFREEFQTLARAHKNFTYVCVCETSSVKKMKTGFITIPMILKTIKTLKGKHFYIIGPPAMMRNMSEGLEEAGVSKSHIIVEKFS